MWRCIVFDAGHRNIDEDEYVRWSRSEFLLHTLRAYRSQRSRVNISDGDVADHGIESHREQFYVFVTETTAMYTGCTPLMQCLIHSAFYPLWDGA